MTFDLAAEIVGNSDLSQVASIDPEWVPAERNAPAPYYQRMRREHSKLRIWLSRVLRDEQRAGGKITSDRSARGQLSLHDGHLLSLLLRT